MWKIGRYLILSAVLLAAATVQAPAQEAKLLDVLRSDATLREKSNACQQLARIATKESVPTLAQLLKDEKLSHMARYALEPIQDPSVDAALRDALGKVEGSPRLGIIGSLGVRRDSKAVDALAVLLEETDVAQAAARALGNIGTSEAANHLEAALPNKSGGGQLAICEGLLRCAEALRANDQIEASQAIYNRLRHLKGASPQVRAAALRGAILARGKHGIPLLVEAMHDADYALAAAAARTAMESPDAEVADALMAVLPKLPAERQALLILSLTARGDSRVLPTVLQATQSSDGPLRILAFRALKRIGDASCVPLLLNTAAEGNGELAAAAMETLESIQDKSVDDQIAARLAKAKGKMRLVIIDLAERRHTTAAAPALWRAASDADTAVRAAALAALGTIVDTADLPKLIARLSETNDDREAAALDEAIREVCLRSEDREAVAARVAAALPAVDQSAKLRILETLNILGGKTALNTAAAAARSSDEQLRDAASRVLGKWRSDAVAPVLVDLHDTASDNRIRIRAVRAYIRIARQFDMPADRRAAMCRTALSMAERDEDKRLVLEVLLRYPDEEMQAIALEAAKDPALREEATLVVMGMASEGIDRAELGRAMAEAGHTPVSLEIIKAEYGAGAKTKDVTATLRKYAKNYRIIFLPSASFNESFGGDPAQGIVKHLKINYRIDGKEGEISLPENTTVVLPMPQ